MNEAGGGDSGGSGGAFGPGRLICSCHNEGFSLPVALIAVVLLDVGVKTRTVAPSEAPPPPPPPPHSPGH